MNTFSSYEHEELNQARGYRPRPEAPSSAPKDHSLTEQYKTCSDSLLFLWMQNLITDAEYHRITDRLNQWYEDRM